MELKDFIKDTVSQIAEAVTELNGETSIPMTVNPAKTEFLNGKQFLNMGFSKSYLTNIDFDLTLSLSEGKGNNAKVGVFASVIGIGASSNENAKNESISKIKFTLPVLLPMKEV
ncbi:hypothetical protein R3O55_012735 [Bacteroides hominis]|uniref:hypothetical protein n=1 Tax=Bacteroides hominis TaxID=2763023 RepID=UPI0029490D79|nr:hypothetical protein [Bacteroides hominis (ex Liu et al. 2022)]MDV6135765.1 hypothetical protein [Bacteroides hominis (ex Liu et al. 2022)]MDV6153126.1 hypothetical protein [Bacteroides hominis (ex Liu et al. 2022)]